MAFCFASRRILRRFQRHGLSHAAQAAYTPSLQPPRECPSRMPLRPGMQTATGLLLRRRRGKDLAPASGFWFWLRLGSLLRFAATFVFVSHASKHDTEGPALKRAKSRPKLARDTEGYVDARESARLKRSPMQGHPEPARPPGSQIVPAGSKRGPVAHDPLPSRDRRRMIRRLPSEFPRPLDPNAAQCCSASIFPRASRARFPPCAGTPDAARSLADPASEFPRSSRRILRARSSGSAGVAACGPIERQTGWAGRWVLGRVSFQ